MKKMIILLSIIILVFTIIGPPSKKLSSKYKTNTASDVIGRSATLYSDYSYRYISSVPDYQWYIGCSPTSGANILSYWDSRGYPNLVASGTNYTTLISNLATYIRTDRKTGSTSQVYLEPGMENYWKSKGYNVNVVFYSHGWFNDAFEDHRTEMNARRPDWVSTQDHPTYGDHLMTGVGYEQYYSYDDFSWHNSVIVHDTWWNTVTDCWVNYKYFDATIAVKPL